MAAPVAGSSNPRALGGSTPFWRIVLLVAAGICAVIVFRNVFVAAHRIIGWAVAAGIVALLLAPIVAALDRRLPRGVAIAVTIVAIASAAGGLAWLYTSSLSAEIESLRESGPAIAADIEERTDRIGQIARDVSLAEQVTELTDRLEETSGSGSQLRTAALSAPAYFVSMILTVFLLIFGPRIVSGGLDQLPERHQDRTRRALLGAARETQVYAWCSIAQGVVVGIAVWAAGVLLDLPGVGLLALFAAVVAMLPYLGVTVAWLPTLVLALGTAPAVQVVALACVAGILQILEAVWWRRTVDRRSIHVGPAIPLVVAVLGYAVYGVGGALYGCVLAVLGLAVLDQLAPGDAELPTPVDEPAPTTDA